MQIEISKGRLKFLIKILRIRRDYLQGLPTFFHGTNSTAARNREKIQELEESVNFLIDAGKLGLKKY